MPSVSKRWTKIEQLLDQVLDQREARKQALAVKLQRLRVRKAARPTNPTPSVERDAAAKRRRSGH